MLSNSRGQQANCVVLMGEKTATHCLMLKSGNEDARELQMGHLGKGS